MASFVVDASVWGSWFLPDTNHTRTVLWLRPAIVRGDRFLTPSFGLVEVAGTLARRTDTANGLEAVELLMEMDHLTVVPMTDEIVASAVDLAARFRTTGADAVYVALARAVELPLVTWDRQQRERGGQATPTFRPDELQAPS